jgi:hypothetical protein
MTVRPEALRVARRWIASRPSRSYPIGEEPLTGDEARAAIALSRRVRGRDSVSGQVAR